MMPSLLFYDTEKRSLVPFEPLAAGRVKLYTCGPTVYNHAHIGNLRTFLFEDLLRRTLKFFGYEVLHVMNLTDVDDKIIRDAGAQGVEIDTLTAPYIESFFAALDVLHAERAEVYPRATRHIPEMIAIIEDLIAKGHAYVAEGSVFFRLASDEDYGRLSRIDVHAARRGERVAADEYEKEDVRDFVLWKSAKPGEPTWDSPWGPGRPGWHIECSAMSMKYLGTTFDIHCGGVDNIFPHHENEIAQSESATGELFVRTWLHAEHLLVDGEKMSKSLGNQYTLQDLLDRGVEPRALRYVYLSAHYRQKLNFTFESLGAATSALKRLDDMRFRLGNALEGAGPGRLTAAVERFTKDFRAGLADDLNSPRALAALFTLVKDVNVGIEKGLGTGDRDRVLAALAEADQVLGFLDAALWQSAAPAGDDEEISELVRQRDAARAARQWAEADRLRAELTARGIVIEDTPQGSRWKRG
ncbi:MAG: cysteine--tRNA ligase [Thermoanaerobaculia bacterium]|nr:cysteine--tRNA ligase [Thermoanaerobaculia bacterium]